jgi:hypothetical protein
LLGVVQEQERRISWGIDFGGMDRESVEYFHVYEDSVYFVEK